MKRFIKALTILAMCCLLGGGAGYADQVGDPCLASTGLAKSAVALNVTAAAQLVAAVAGKTIYVCGVDATAAGTSPTIQFQSGTGTACGTNTLNLSGTLAPTANAVIVMGGAGVLFQSRSSDALCAATGGTTPSFQGVLTFVQG